MSFFFHRFYKSASTLQGSFTIETDKMRGLLRHFIVKPATASNTYDLAVSDGSELNLFEREAVEDELNETMQIPVQGKLFITISGATIDEVFKIYLAIQEQ